MNIEQAKAKLDDVGKSTALKHPKVLVAELCTVVKFLLDEIDKIKTPSVSVLRQNFDFDTQKPKYTPHPCIRPNPMIPCQPPWRDKPKPQIPGYESPKQRSGNAGDAE